MKLTSTFLQLALAGAMTVAGTTSLAQTSNLPELGDSATRILGPVQERLIGQEFYRELITHPGYINDHELTDYLQSMGNRVGSHADLRGIPLTFSLIRDNNLNAFAVPGGYITFNTGLLLWTETESELASVVGHEIAHLTQRHLPRLLAAAEEMKIPAMAAIFASILLGGQAAVAGLQATTAAVAGTQLSYSRDFEREADAVGIKLLAQADYNPRAMATFFAKLERFTRHESIQVPEFLRTHPLSYSRVAASEVRANEYPVKTYHSSFDYYIAKARIRALYVDRQENTLQFFEDEVDEDPEFVEAAEEYGAAVTLFERRQYADARNRLAPLVEQYPEQLWFQLMQARIELALGELDAGLARLRKAQEIHPGKTHISYYLADALINEGQYDEAKKEIRYQLRRNSDDHHLYSLLAEVNGKLGNLAEAHQARAEYFASLGAYPRAIASIRLALKESGEDGYLGQSLKARQEELQEKERIYSGVN